MDEKNDKEGDIKISVPKINETPTKFSVANFLSRGFACLNCLQHLLAMCDVSPSKVFEF